MAESRDLRYFVDEHIDGAESLERPGDGSLTLVRGGDVKRQGVGAVRQPSE